MDKLIEALTILRKYGNPDYPTACEHDELFVNINPELVSTEDTITLSGLGFTAAESGEMFMSYRYGSC